MVDSGVWWWWLLLGGLIGWAASWLASPTLGRGRVVALAAVPDRPVEPVVERMVEKVVERPVERNVEKPLVAPIGHANGLAPIRPPGKIMDRAMDLVIDRAAAGAAGYAVRGMDDFEVIVGINTGIAALLKAQGIRMFWELAQTPNLRLQAVLDEAGGDFGTANPSTWARQAGLAANNQWGELRMLQDVLEADV